jgi:hypothetical protein
LGQVFSGYSVSLATYSAASSTLLIIIIIIRGWYNRPFSGLSNSGLGSTSLQETRKK